MTVLPLIHCTGVPFDPSRPEAKTTKVGASCRALYAAHARCTLHSDLVFDAVGPPRRGHLHCLHLISDTVRPEPSHTDLGFDFSLPSLLACTAALLVPEPRQPLTRHDDHDHDHDHDPAAASFFARPLLSLHGPQSLRTSDLAPAGLLPIARPVMEKKRKLPARAAARVEHVSKKRTSTPPTERSITPKTATPQPDPEPVPEPAPQLPTSISNGAPLPVVDTPQPSNLSSSDYQSVQERYVEILFSFVPKPHSR